MKRTVLPIVLLVSVMLGLFIFFYFSGLGEPCDTVYPLVKPVKASIISFPLKSVDKIKLKHQSMACKSSSANYPDAI